MNSVREAIKRLGTILQIRKYIFSDLIIVIKQVPFGYPVFRPVYFTKVSKLKIVTTNFLHLGLFFWVQKCLWRVSFRCFYQGAIDLRFVFIFSLSRFFGLTLTCFVC